MWCVLCLQEVNFGMLDCSDGCMLKSLETLLAHIMLPALRSQQVHTHAHTGSLGCACNG